MCPPAIPDQQQNARAIVDTAIRRPSRRRPSRCHDIAPCKDVESRSSLIVTAKMNDVDPQAWLADILARIAGHPAHRLDELLPWNWRARNEAVSQAA